MLNKLLGFVYWREGKKLDNPIENLGNGYSLTKVFLGYKVEKLRLWAVDGVVTQRMDCFYVDKLTYSFFSLKKNLILPKPKTYDHYMVSLNNIRLNSYLGRGYYDKTSVENIGSIDLDKIGVDFSQLFEIILSNSKVYYSKDDKVKMYRLLLLVKNNFITWHIMDNKTYHHNCKLAVNAETKEVLVYN